MGPRINIQIGWGGDEPVIASRMTSAKPSIIRLKGVETSVSALSLGHFAGAETWRAYRSCVQRRFEITGVDELLAVPRLGAGIEQLAQPFDDAADPGGTDAVA